MPNLAQSRPQGIRKRLHGEGFKNSGGKAWPLNGDHNVLLRILKAHNIDEPPMQNDLDAIDLADDTAESEAEADGDEAKADAEDPENGDPQRARARRSGPRPSYNEDTLAKAQAPSLKAGTKRGRPPKGLATQPKPAANKAAKGLKGIKLYNAKKDVFHRLDAQLSYAALCEHASVTLGVWHTSTQLPVFSAPSPTRAHLAHQLAASSSHRDAPRCGLRAAYTDSEGDKCAISNDHELKQAVKTFEPCEATAFLKLVHDGYLSVAPKVSELDDDSDDDDGDGEASLFPAPPPIKRLKSADTRADGAD
jgi:hypothetical protein